VDRIDFEELALKTVDPSLGPTLSPPDSGAHGLGATDKKVSPDNSPSENVVTVFLDSVYLPQDSYTLFLVACAIDVAVDTPRTDPPQFAPRNPNAPTPQRFLYMDDNSPVHDPVHAHS
jgi:hypothetical protein